MDRFLDPLGSGLPCYGLAPGESFDMEGCADDLAYVLDAKGWLVFRRSAVSIGLARTQRADDKVCETNAIKLRRKIPVELLNTVTSFFADVYKQHKSEAFVYLLVRDGATNNNGPGAVYGDWGVVVPKQAVSSARAVYQPLDAVPGWKPAGDIHSHGSMSAFHSGVDDKDEATFDGVHVTVGDVEGGRTRPSVSCSLVVGGFRQSLQLNELFDDPDCQICHPAAWLDMVEKGTYGGTAFDADDYWGNFVKTGNNQNAHNNKTQNRVRYSEHHAL